MIQRMGCNALSQALHSTNEGESLEDFDHVLEHGSESPCLSCLALNCAPCSILRLQSGDVPPLFLQ